jgi:hypothetical protein
VRRHAESDNLVVLAVLLEIERVVALMAVNNKQLISAYNPPLCMLIKVFQLLQPKLVCSPAVLRDCNNLVVRHAALLVSGREVVLALEDDKGWNRPAHRVDPLDYCSPLSIALLNALRPSSTVRGSDYCSS